MRLYFVKNYAGNWSQDLKAGMPPTAPHLLRRVYSSWGMGATFMHQCSSGQRKHLTMYLDLQYNVIKAQLNPAICNNTGEP